MSTSDICVHVFLPGVFVPRLWDLHLRLHAHEGSNFRMLEAAEACQRQLQRQSLP